MSLVFMALSFSAAHAQLVMVNQGFNNAALPSGWTSTVLSGNATANWMPAASAQYGAPAPQAGSHYLWKIWLNSDALLISAPFSLIMRGNLPDTLRAWIYQDNNYDETDSVSFYINTTGSLTGATRIGKVVSYISAGLPGWKRFKFVVPASFTGATNHFLIRGTTSAGIDSYDLSLDELSYETYPAAALCPAISLLPTTGLGANTARLRWLPATGVTGYRVRYRAVGATGFVGSWDAPATQTDTGFAISTLTSGVEYEYQISTVCTGEVFGEYSTVGTFSTFFIAPFTETFAAGTRPAGWAVNSATNTNWAFRVTGLPYADLSPPATLAPVDGAGMAWVDSYNFTAGSNSNLISPSIFLSSGKRWLLRFSHSQDQQYTNTDRIQVRVSVAGSPNFTVLETVRRHNTALTRPTWVVSEVDLTAYAGQNVKLSFLAFNEYGNNMAIDAVRILENMGLDLAVKIVSPSFTACPSAVANVTAQLINRGSTIVNFATTPVSVTSSWIRANSTAMTNFPTAVVNTGTLAPGAMLDVSLGTANLSFIGVPRFSVQIAALTGDVFAGNDTSRLSVFTMTGIDTMTISRRFAGYTGTTASLQTISGFKWNEGIGQSMPANNESAWGFTPNFQGRTVASTPLAAAVNRSWLVGPRFRLRPNTRVSFKAALVGVSETLDANDSLKVMISRDCGQSYQLLYAITRTTNVLTSALRNYTVPILGAANSFVSISFMATNGTSNTGTRTVALDSITIDTVVSVVACAARPVANFTVVQTGLSVTFTNTSTQAASYVWNFGAGATPATATVTTTTPITVTYANAGTAMVSLRATSANTVCVDSVKTMSITVTSAKNALPAVVKAYPNPNKGEFVISTQGFGDELDYELYSPNGQLILKGQALANSQTKINQSELAAGLYILRLNSVQGQRNEKIVVQK